MVIYFFLRSPVDMNGYVQTVSTSSTFFKSTMEDIRRMVVGFSSYSANILNQFDEDFSSDGNLASS